MKRAGRIAIGVATALTLGLATAVVSAHPYGHEPGWGMGQGVGPGAGMGPGGGPGAMGQGFMGHGPMGRGMGPRGAFDPGAMADARSAYLKSVLKITPAQEPAFKAFSDQRKQQVEAMLALRAGAQGGVPATAPERLELRNQFIKKRQELMEKTTTAFKDLYAALTPEQKALVDQRIGFGMMGGRGMGFNRPGR